MLLLSFARYKNLTLVSGSFFLVQVLVEVLSVFVEKTDLLTLEICYLLIPLLNDLLGSENDR